MWSLCNITSQERFVSVIPFLAGFVRPLDQLFSRRNDSCQFFFNLPGFYKFCCDGVYCPDCPMELNISTLQQNVTVTPALNMSCTNTPFTAPFKTEKQPGNFTIKVSYLSQLFKSYSWPPRLQAPTFIVVSCISGKPLLLVRNGWSD